MKTLDRIMGYFFCFIVMPMSFMANFVEALGDPRWTPAQRGFYLAAVTIGATAYGLNMATFLCNKWRHNWQLQEKVEKIFGSMIWTTGGLGIIFGGLWYFGV